jgi:hypothetical protein
VFELAKGAVPNIIPTIEERTGKRVEFEAGDAFEVGHSEAPHVPAPPPAPLVAPVTTLTVQSNPPGAEVIIDAKNYGRAPVTASLPPGSKYVLIRKDGFENWTREIDAKAGVSVIVNGDLRKVQATPNVIVVKPSAPKSAPN